MIKFKLEPWAHQKKAIELSDKVRDLALFFEMGCISGEALIRVNRAGNSRTYKLKDLCHKFNNVWNKKIPSQIRSLKGDSLGLNPIVAVWESGEKIVYEIKAGGETVRATLKHRFYTQKGWKKMGDVSLGDYVALDKATLHGNHKYFPQSQITWGKVTSIKCKGREMTYDIECEKPYPSFVANGFVVHNTGKSGTAINILRLQCTKRRGLYRTLILAPVIVLENWKREFLIHSDLDQKHITVLYGSQKKRLDSFYRAAFDPVTMLQKPHVFITNYEAMQMKELFSKLMQWGPEILICDESHRLKNPSSKRAQKVATLADQCKHRYILTGSPILNNAMDIFMQYRVLDAGQTFGKNFFGFRAKYFVDVNDRWKGQHNYFPDWKPRPQTYAELNKKIYTKALHVLKKDCLDLPTLVRKTIPIDLSADQARMYKEMKEEYITYVNDLEKNEEKPKAIIAQLAITKSLRLQQIASGYTKTDDGNEISIKENPRLKVLSDLLEELTPNNKVIVWAHFKQNVRDIKKLCEKLKLKWAEIHGDIKDKQKEVDLFHTDETCRVMIANQSAGGIGINMVAASYSIFFSRSFSLEHDIQAEARNYRGGSEIHEKVTRIDLVAPGTIDELVLEALKNKQDISKAILSWKGKI